MSALFEIYSQLENANLNIPKHHNQREHHHSSRLRAEFRRPASDQLSQATQRSRTCVWAAYCPLRWTLHTTQLAEMTAALKHAVSVRSPFPHTAGLQLQFLAIVPRSLRGLPLCSIFPHLPKMNLNPYSNAQIHWECFPHFLILIQVFPVLNVFISKGN